MKVFQVGHGYMANSGMGVIEYLYQVSNHLHKEGVEVTFIQFDKKANTETEYDKEIINGVTLLHFPTYKFKGMSLPQSFADWLDQLCKTEQNFIFHLHSVFFIPNYKIAQYLQKRNIPYIHTPHDSYTEASMSSNKLLKKLYIKAFDKSVMDGAKVVHAITDQGARSIAQYTTNPNIKLITNFVPHSPVFSEKNIKKQICFIGRMDIYQKGIDLMLEAFSQFLTHSPEVVFVLVGQYLEDEIEEFTELINKYGLDSSQVIVRGKVSTDEKYQILNDSYAYFQLSRFEGFGLSIVEALSVGKPVIISDKVPIQDAILKHEAGYIAADVQEALGALKKIFNLEQSRYKQMSNNAQRCYELHFNPEQITKQLIEMYQVCL